MISFAECDFIARVVTGVDVRVCCVSRIVISWRSRLGHDSMAGGVADPHPAPPARLTRFVPAVFQREGDPVVTLQTLRRTPRVVIANDRLEALGG